MRFYVNSIRFQIVYCICPYILLWKLIVLEYQLMQKFLAGVRTLKVRRAQRISLVLLLLFTIFRSHLKIATFHKVFIQKAVLRK